jgi:2-keto-4-pentenoate hydratase/2-oxohepta-3-ene-1,7-dioic acid hydratase in catechol pathway
VVQLAFYNDYTLGVLTGDAIVDAAAAVKDLRPSSPQALLEAVITAWTTYGPRIAEAVQGRTRVPLERVTLRPPVPRPGQLVCLAGNYLEPAHPSKEPFNAFLKSNTSVIGHGGTVDLPPAEATVFHFEPELALVIGRRASRLSEAEALDCVFGYTPFIDASARGLHGGFFLGKSWHTFGPMGPALVTADEVGDPNALGARLWINGTLKHDFSTREMARHVPELLAEVTSVLTLEPGDVVSTGTHHYALSPVQHGDLIRLEIDRLGPALAVTCRDERQRTWNRA